MQAPNANAGILSLDDLRAFVARRQPPQQTEEPQQRPQQPPQQPQPQGQHQPPYQPQHPPAGAVFQNTNATVPLPMSRRQVPPGLRGGGGGLAAPAPHSVQSIGPAAVHPAPRQFHAPPPQGQFQVPPPRGQFHAPPPQGQFHAPPPQGQFQVPPPRGQVPPAGRSAPPRGDVPPPTGAAQVNPTTTRAATTTTTAPTRTIRHAPEPAAAPPRREPDPAALQAFKDLYAAQDNQADLAAHLQAQRHSAAGTTGTLDLDKCMALIETHDITFITTDTGTGKSTLIPMALLKRHKDRLVTFSAAQQRKRRADKTPGSVPFTQPTDGLWIVSAQPRRTSAINLAGRVAHVLETEPEYMGLAGAQDSSATAAHATDESGVASATATTTGPASRALGELVGYSVRGEQSGELGETPLMYVTNYTFFLHLLWRRPQDIPFTYVILDEFHERTPEVEVILLLLKLTMLNYPGRMKLILSSATGDAVEWSSFFDGVGTIGVLNQATCMYPVHDFHAEDISKLLGTVYTPPTIGRDGVVSSLQLQQLLLTLRQLLTFLASELVPQHSILVFLPGRTVVESTREWILSNLGDQLDPVVWYRDVDLNVIQAALTRETFTKKKVYLATNIAEVGLTLPDVVFVIDLGTVKRPLVTASKPQTVAFPPLQLLWEATANARQRRGRVGRVQRGFYMSLLSTSHHAALSANASPIQSAVLHELVLHTLQVTSAPLTTFSLCREQPQWVSVLYSLRTLRDAGMVMDMSHALAEAECLHFASGAEKTDQIVTKEWSRLVEAQRLKDPPPPRAEDTAGDAAAAVADAEDKTAKAAAGADGQADAADTTAEKTSTQRRAPAQYQVTLKGCIAAHSPVDIAAGTTIFLGIQFGVSTLSILISAIEATKTPFFVPYDIADRVQRHSSCEQVSRDMALYHGALKSDIVSSLGALLDYLDMQRDGLSEEGQEQWCVARHLSRARLIDTVNLVTQMKTQLRAIIPFVDVRDIDVLKSQYEKQAETLMLLNVASHMQWAVHVTESPEHAQRKHFSGEGIFTQMRCSNNISVPTVCPWERFSVCVPLSLQTSYNRLLATFATQLDAEMFNMVLLLFATSILYVPPPTPADEDTAAAPSDNPTPPVAGAGLYTFFVHFMNVSQSFHCDVLTAQQIIQLRRMQCAQMRVMQLQVEERVKPEDNAAMCAHLDATDTDFGIPEQFRDRPDLIPMLLHTGLQQLVGRLKEKLQWCKEDQRARQQAQREQHRMQRGKGRGGAGTASHIPALPPSVPPPNMAMCVATTVPPPTRSAAVQSLLIQSGNGIRPLATLDEAEADALLAPTMPVASHSKKPQGPHNNNNNNRGNGVGRGRGRGRGHHAPVTVEDDSEGDDEDDKGSVSSTASSVENAAQFQFGD